MRTFSGGFNGVVGGGSCFWFIVLTSQVSGEKYIYSSTPLSAIAGYTIKSGRLLNMSNIDQRIDIYSENIAKTPSFSFDIYNIDNDGMFEYPIGSLVELRMGFNTVAAVTNSELFYTGKITELSRSEINQIRFECIGLLNQYMEVNIGQKVNNVIDKTSDTIYPIVYGQWNGENDYAPLVKEINSLQGVSYVFAAPDIETDLSTVTTYKIYDKQNKKGYGLNLVGESGTTMYIDGNKSVVAIHKGTTQSALDCNSNRSASVQVLSDAYNLVNLDEETYILNVLGQNYVVINKYTANGLYYLHVAPKEIYKKPFAASGSTFYLITDEGELSQTLRRSFTLPLAGIKTPITGETSKYVNRHYGLSNLFDQSTGLPFRINLINNNKTGSFHFVPVVNLPEIENLNIILVNISIKASKGASLSNPGIPVVHVNGYYNDELKFIHEVGMYDYPNYQTIKKNLINEEISAKGAFDNIRISMGVFLKQNAYFKDIYFDVVCTLDTKKIDVWATGTGRQVYDAQTGWSYIEAPASVISDFITTTSSIGLTASNIDSDSFSAFEADRSDWKLAVAFY